MSVRTFVISFYCGSGIVINYGSGSDFLARYGSGSGSSSASQNVTVSTVPVPVPQRCLQAGGASRPCRQRPDPRGSRHSAARLIPTQIYTRPLGFILLIDCRKSTVVLGSGWGRVMKAFFSRSVGDPWHFGAGPDPRIRTSVTPFFSDFKDASYFFLITYPQAHYLQFKILLKFCVKSLVFKHYFNPLNTFMRKGKDPKPDPYLWLMNPDPQHCSARKLFSIQNSNRFRHKFSPVSINFVFKIARKCIPRLSSTVLLFL